MVRKNERKDKRRKDRKITLINGRGREGLHYHHHHHHHNYTTTPLNCLCSGGGDDGDGSDGGDGGGDSSPSFPSPNTHKKLNKKKGSVNSHTKSHKLLSFVTDSIFILDPSFPPSYPSYPPLLPFLPSRILYTEREMENYPDRLLLFPPDRQTTRLLHPTFTHRRDRDTD